LGVAIMAIVLGIIGVLEFLVGGLAIAALSALGRTISVHGHTTVSRAVDILGWLLGSLPIALGILTLIVAVGLWLLKRWAFWTTVAIMVIALVRQVIEFIKPHDSSVSIIIGTIIPVLVLLYLFVVPGVRAAFHVGGEGYQYYRGGT
jgi:uncharacterized membrane protein (DUF2068 family)